MALARVKTYWADMKAGAVASQDSDGSRVPAEHYFQEVLQGARLIETQCSKDVMFNNMYHCKTMFRWNINAFYTRAFKN